MLLVKNSDISQVALLLKRFGLQLEMSADNKAIPGSFWGDNEAGLIGDVLYARSDTPIHSILHEACHFICMDQTRRSGLDTNAGGDYDEENAVCYLQILLSGYLDFMGKNIMFKDMDDWGYSFRLGSAQKWFEEDAQDAQQWLISEQIIASNNDCLFRLRDN